MVNGRSGLPRLVVGCVAVLAIGACMGPQSAAAPGRAQAPAASGATANPPGLPEGQVTREQVLVGRELVLHHGCGDCHGGYDNPAADGWLAGVQRPDQEFLIGPCATMPGAEPCFRTRPRNITPDNATGIGRFSARQIFNSLRYGLRPGETPDVEITSTVPAQGNFPANPKYLAPPMPWQAFRHMADDELWAIVAYLKHGLKPVSNRVQDSEGPPDFWAGAYAEIIGTRPPPNFPTAREELRP